MRRIAFSLAMLGAVTLSACSGGSVLNFDSSTNAQRTIVTTVGGTNVARVLAGSSITLSALAVRGGPNAVLNTNNFTWTATLVASGSYTVNSGGVTKPCGPVTITPAGGKAADYTADFTPYVTVDPTNGSNAIFSPPATIPVPATSPPGTIITLPGEPAGTAPYCVVVTATPQNGGSAGAGSITVAVVPPLAPEQ